jgi:hypothetical protein
VLERSCYDERHCETRRKDPTARIAACRTGCYADVTRAEEQLLIAPDGNVVVVITPPPGTVVSAFKVSKTDGTLL